MWRGNGEGAGEKLQNGLVQIKTLGNWGGLPPSFRDYYSRYSNSFLF